MRQEQVIEVELDRIRVEQRIRRDHGDIAALAKSIKERGLLQPIGIDPEDRLIFGERRLKAFRHLGRSTIPARVIRVDSILLAEHDENELRKDFTPCERVAIGQAIEREIGNRQGQRTNKPRENFPKVAHGMRTDEVAAEKAGFGNRKTYQQAKTVVEHGTPELVEAMDKGEASVSAAAQVATLPQEEQAEVVAKGGKAIKERAKRAKQEKAEKSRKNRRKPLPELFQFAAFDLGKAVCRIEKLMTDDRLSKNAKEVVPGVRADLLRSLEKLQSICSQYPIESINAHEE